MSKTQSNPNVLETLTAGHEKNDEFQAAVQVVSKLQENGHTAYFAGGCVRDMLLGRPVSDFDVATSAKPKQVQKLFRRTLAVGAKFGIIVVRHRGQSIEVATFRTDGEYQDGRRPDSVVFSSPEEDALRRDFTVNGLFFDPMSQRIYDFVGGQADLWAGRIRAIGHAQERISEDYLRLLRALRFSARFNFKIDAATEAAIIENAPKIVQVSPERIREELDKMFKGSGRAFALEMLLDTQLLESLDLPIYIQLEGRREETLRQFALLPSSCPSAVCWAIVTGELRHAERWLHSLKSSNDLRDQVLSILSKQEYYKKYSTLSLAAKKRLLRHECAPLQMQFVWSELLSRDGDLSEIAAAYSDHERFGAHGDNSLFAKALVGGSDLIAMGHKPNPKFKAWLELAEDWQLEGELDKSVLLSRLAAEISKTE